MMKLGGNIVLDGCDNLEPATLIVLKKMVGNYARKISEKNSFDELMIKVQNSGDNYKLEATLTKVGSQEIKNAEDNNLFFALNNALKEFL
jgi:hypothetical protein